jgi:ubiquinone/menaquinone biosynthesis C-methylase UbiE
LLQEELKRLDIINKCFMVMRKDRMCNYRFDVHDTGRVLDLGTGTGVWANMVSEYVDICVARGTVVSALVVDDADI